MYIYQIVYVFDILNNFFQMLNMMSNSYFFNQGTTIGPLVKFLKVKRKEAEEPTMSAKLSNRLIDHSMTCLEAIIGVSGDNFLRDK